MSAALLDTLMNVEIFLFIALLIWLYFRKSGDNGDS